MGAGSVTAAAGPSTASAPATAPIKAKALSRSLTFEVENDEDLAAFMGDNSSTKHSTADDPINDDHIELAVFITQAPWVKYKYWPKELSAVMPLRYLGQFDFPKRTFNSPFLSYLNPIAQGDTAITTIISLVRQEFSMQTNGNNLNVLVKLTRNALDDTTVDIELHVRWTEKDFESLKTPDALGNEFVQMYWANGGAPVAIVNNELVWTHTAEGGVDSTISTLTVPATFDIVPCAGPSEPFALKLFDYQLRTLAWMQGIEDREPSLFYAPNLFPVEDGAGDMWIDLESKSFIKMDMETQQQRNVTSGIIAVHISLLFHGPEANYIKTSLQDILTCDFVIVSYSFLVNNVYRGASKSGRNLYKINKKLDLKNSAANRQKFVTSSKKGAFAFTWCHFYRIVCDELHEVLEKQKAIKDQVLQLSGDCLWGLTGTPTFTSINVICRYADFLNLKATQKWVTPKLELFRFIQNRVRRNEPDVTYPPPVFETFSCRQTPIERAFYQSCIHSGVVNLLKLCNHYQIGREGANLGAHAAMSIEKVTQMVQKNRVAEMADLDDRIIRMEEEGEELRIALDESDDKRAASIKTTEMKIDTIKVKVAEMRAHRASIQAQFNFFENFVNTYLSKGGQKIECNVCLEEDVQGEIGIVPCGHSFCGECADAISTQGKCPSCREVFQVGEVMKVLPPPAVEPVKETADSEEAGAEDGPENLDPNMFGSKIREVVKYIKEESLKSDDHRFIVFIQYSDLADLVSAALKTYGLSTARVKNGWQQRERALRLFRAGLSKPASDTVENSDTVLAEVPESVVDPLDPKGKGKRVAEAQPEAAPKAAKQVKLNKPAQKPVKVLMLSARDSVSGLNLTEASHCIILHPFMSGREENAIASEQQGIARVLRKGQEKTVKIVRFYVEGTVEQGMHEARVQALDAAR
ncbi:hypothetical protein HDU77_008692 [Chytriomyces hyalinus]|nr:hypothetical protein HDU77_008692 [Chytriomyces hyalinus]